MSGLLKTLAHWRPSASLIVAAQSAAKNRYKILGLKRSAKSGVMPNHYVFPGGNMSASDSDSKWLTLFADNNRELPEGMSKLTSLRICAIRETFEECGILICRRTLEGAGGRWAAYVEDPEIETWQHRVHDDPEQFYELCRKFELYPDLWALNTWCNWMTPLHVKAKFNTVFFLACFDREPRAHVDAREVQNLMYATPEEYLQTYSSGNILLPIPQFYELTRLKSFPKIDELLRFAAERQSIGCEIYLPHRIQTSNGLVSIFPGDDLYPEKLDENHSKPVEMESLPNTHHKNRIEHDKLNENSYKLVVENCKPKDGHLPPKPQ